MLALESLRNFGTHPAIIDLVPTPSDIVELDIQPGLGITACPNKAEESCNFGELCSGLRKALVSVQRCTTEIISADCETNVCERPGLFSPLLGDLTCLLT